MTEQRGGSDGVSEGGEVRCDVVDRGDKSLVHDVRESNEATTCEGHGQEETHHGRSLAEVSRTPGRASSPELRDLGERPRVPRSIPAAIAGVVRLRPAW